MGVGEITGILDYSAVSVRMTGATQCHEGRVLRDRDLECIVFVMGWSWAKRVILPITQTKKKQIGKQIKKGQRKELQNKTKQKSLKSFDGDEKGCFFFLSVFSGSDFLSLLIRAVPILLQTEWFYM